MNKHYADKNFLRYICVALVAMLLAGCSSIDPDQLGDTGNPVSSEIPQETVHATELPEGTESVASHPGKETGFIDSYPLGTAVSYDLDGDGTEEIITVNAEECSNGQLVIDGATMEYMAINPTGYYTILNVDQQNNELLIGISDYGFSDDFVTVLYAYNGKQITEVGYYEEITGDNSWNLPGAVVNGDGTISAKTRFDVLGTWEAQALYRVESGMLKDITDVYSYSTWEEQPNGWKVTTKVEIVMYEDIWNSETEVIIPAGTKITMTGLKKGEIEGTYWVCFESAGKVLWMAAETVDWYTYVAAADGFIQSEDAFDGFFYAG